MSLSTLKWTNSSKARYLARLFSQNARAQDITTEFWQLLICRASKICEIRLNGWWLNFLTLNFGNTAPLTNCLLVLKSSTKITLVSQILEIKCRHYAQTYFVKFPFKALNAFWSFKKLKIWKKFILYHAHCKLIVLMKCKCFFA